MSKGYTTQNEIEKFLNTSISEDITSFIEASEKFIDEYTERNFIADSDASERKYDGNGKQVLPIDDCIEIEEVNVGTNFWGDSHVTIDTSGTDRYYTLPTNNEAEGVPITSVVLRNRYWIRGLANHKIKAKWGYSEDVPSDVSWVATFLTASIYRQGQGGNISGVKSERIGEYQVSFQSESELKDFNKAKQILDNYKRYYL